MPDYGRPLRFGVFPTPEAGKLDEVLALARVADEENLEYVGIQDHPYQRRFLDTWMLMATVLAKTERVSVFPDVANLPLRPPAVLAKSAASLDVLSDGRFELGLGAGSFWEAVEAMGGPRRSPGEAVDALVEAIEVIRLMWSDQRSVRFDGRYYRLARSSQGHRRCTRSASGSASAAAGRLPWSAEPPTAGCPRADGPRPTGFPTCRRASTRPRSLPAATPR